MIASVKRFLKKIGLRALTEKEDRELHLLRLREGKGGISGILDAHAEEKTGKGKKKRD